MRKIDLLHNLLHNLFINTIYLSRYDGNYVNRHGNEVIRLNMFIHDFSIDSSIYSLVGEILRIVIIIF